jgi:hypothetical protein
MRLSTSAHVRQSPRTASRVVEGRAVVVVIDSQALHTLNDVGTYVWSRADGRSLAAIVDELVDEYEVEPQRATEDVVHFAEELVRVGALDVLETP